MSALMLVTCLAAMEATIVSTAIPRITSELSGIELVSWVYAIYMLTTAVATPIFGKLSDLFGRKLMIQIGIMIFILGSTLCGLANNMEQLILFRAIQGIGAGAAMPMTMTIIGDLYPEPKSRAKAQGWISAVWGVSGVLGPLVGGFLVDNLSWRYIFYLNIPFGLLSFVVLALTYHETKLTQKRVIDYAGAGLFSAGTIAFLYALLTGSQDQNWLDPTILSCFLIAICLLVLFWFVEKRFPEPLIPLELFQNRTVRLINGLTIAGGVMVISMVAYIPIWSQGVMMKNATEAGLVLTPMPVCWTFGSLIAGNLMGRLQGERIIQLGSICLIFASIGLFTLTSNSPEIQTYLSVGLVGFGMGLITPIQMVILQTATPPQKRGTAVALNTFLNTFSQTLGAALFGMIFNLVVQVQGKEESPIGENLSFETSNIPTEQLTLIRSILAEGVHAIFFVTCIVAIASFLFASMLAWKKKLTVDQ